MHTVCNQGIVQDVHVREKKNHAKTKNNNNPFSRVNVHCFCLLSQYDRYSFLRNASVRSVLFLMRCICIFASLIIICFRTLQTKKQKELLEWSYFMYCAFIHRKIVLQKNEAIDLFVVVDFF